LRADRDRKDTLSSEGRSRFTKVDEIDGRAHTQLLDAERGNLG
jgi:hypothetical protein